MTSPAPERSNDIAVCTLADGDYLIGAGALANSLYASGFRGVLWIGYRGALPGWAGPSVQDNARWRSWVAAEGLEIRFVAIPGTRALSGEKPDFMRRLFDQLAPQIDGLFFFDSDIVVHAPWHYFAGWLDSGVALCTEAQPIVPPGHPHRRYWQGMVEEIGRSVRPLEYYVNSGFVGLRRPHLDVLTAWSALIEQCEKRMGTEISGIRHGIDTLHPLWATDQHMLNAAMMGTTVPLAIVGPEGMDFFPFGLWMAHATNREKPWRASYLKQAMTGFAPSLAQRAFWRHVRGPIPVLGANRIAMSTLALKINALISRFYQRSG
jgi:hypothetical protein